MAVRGIIFDIDGTLVDTNPAHVEAWRRAFKRFRFDIPAERIRVKKHLQATMTSAGIDLPSLADVLVTKDAAEASKPAPDLVIVVSEKLAVNPTDCAMVGDTVYDGQGVPGGRRRLPGRSVRVQLRGGAAPGRRLRGLA